MLLHYPSAFRDRSQLNAARSNAHLYESKGVDKPCTRSETQSYQPRCGFDGNRGEFTFRSGTTIAPTSPFRQLPPEVRAQMDADVAMSRRDAETAVAASVPIIVSPLSHCYLDVPYAEPSADPGQPERRGRVGPQLYSPKTAAESFDWEPTESLGLGRATHVAGVEAAI